MCVLFGYAQFLFGCVRMYFLALKNLDEGNMTLTSYVTKSRSQLYSIILHFLDSFKAYFQFDEKYKFNSAKAILRSDQIKNIPPPH